MLPTCMCIAATEDAGDSAVVFHMHIAALKSMHPVEVDKRGRTESASYEHVRPTAVMSAADLDACPMEASCMRAMVSPLSSA